jgi:hypothetical protein
MTPESDPGSACLAYFAKDCMPRFGNINLDTALPASVFRCDNNRHVYNIRVTFIDIYYK